MNPKYISGFLRKWSTASYDRAGVDSLLVTILSHEIGLLLLLGTKMGETAIFKRRTQGKRGKCDNFFLSPSRRKHHHNSLRLPEMKMLFNNTEL